MKERNRELLAHVALALSRYEADLTKLGIRVPEDLEFATAFATDLATVRQQAPTVGEKGELPDAGSMTNHPVLTKREAAASLRVSVRTLERLIASGALPVVELGKSPRVRRIDLDAYIESLGSRTFRDEIESKETA